MGYEFPELDEVKTNCQAELKLCNTKLDALKAIYDLLPAPYPDEPEPSSMQWPPMNRKHTRYDHPPFISQLPEEFKIASRPLLVREVYAAFLVANNDQLQEPLDYETKREWADINANRMFKAVQRASFAFQGLAPDARPFNNALVVGMQDQFGSLIPVPFDCRKVRAVDNFLGPPKRRAPEAIGLITTTTLSRKRKYACFLRFLIMEDFDVTKEIQALADAGSKIGRKYPVAEASGGSVKEGKTVKAMHILRWVILAAYETNNPYVLVSNGLKNIWFYVSNGVIEVGLTMRPTTEPTQANVGDFSIDGHEPLSLTQSLLAFTWASARVWLKEAQFKVSLILTRTEKRDEPSMRLGCAKDYYHINPQFLASAFPPHLPFRSALLAICLKPTLPPSQTLLPQKTLPMQHASSKTEISLEADANGGQAEAEVLPAKSRLKRSLRQAKFTGEGPARPYPSTRDSAPAVTGPKPTYGAAHVLEISSDSSESSESESALGRLAKRRRLRKT